MRPFYPTAAGMVMALAISSCIGTARAQPNELTLDCKPDQVAFAAQDEVATVTVGGPIATPSGGTPPYTVDPDPNNDILLTGSPELTAVLSYKVTDANQDTAECSIFVAILAETAPPTPAPTTTAPTTPGPTTPTPSSSGPTQTTPPTPAPTTCPPGADICDDPHMQGLRGQRIDWSGVDGGWYSLVKDDGAAFQVNVRLTAPLSEAFPDRQLITGVSILAEKHSVVIKVKNPYDTATDGCPHGISPCLANGGLQIEVDEEQRDDLITSYRDEHVAGFIHVSASNLPVECRQFGGDKIWARMYDEMLQGRRQLVGKESFENWILRFGNMAASDWCALYITQNDLADVQSTHAIFKIDTPGVTVRLNAGVNFQGDGQLDWDGRALPDMEFWQMNVGLHGLSLENKSLSGILGETARPVLDSDGREVMEGYDALRGAVEDYRVSGPLGTDFALLHTDDWHE